MLSEKEAFIKIQEKIELMKRNLAESRELFCFTRLRIRLNIWKLERTIKKLKWLMENDHAWIK